MFNAPGPEHPHTDNTLCLYFLDKEKASFDDVAKEVRECVDSGGVVSFCYKGHPMNRGKMWKDGDIYKTEWGFYFIWSKGEQDNDLERLMLLVMDI